jgi:hypothetical protein
MARGKKDDTNPKDRLGVKKVPLSLVPMVGLIYEAMAFKEGDINYGAFNYRRKKVRRRVYLEAILRHTLQALAGEDIDRDTIVRDKRGKVIFPGIPHEAKIRACCGIILDAQECGTLIDDRYEMDWAAKLLARFTAGDYHKARSKTTRTPARTLDEVRAEAARAAKARKRRRSHAKRSVQSTVVAAHRRRRRSAAHVRGRVRRSPAVRRARA